MPTAGPRACGVGPSTHSRNSGRPDWSPRVRGWSPRPAGRRASDPLVPARAGLVPGVAGFELGTGAGPRACGVGPEHVEDLRRAMLWSPRVRGWSRRSRLPGRLRRLVPARAGLVPLRVPCPSRSDAGPRACGVGPPADWLCPSDPFWSPRVRGWSRGVENNAGAGCLVPARAGLVPEFRILVQDDDAGPRACGVGPHALNVTTMGELWSPRVRGWSLRPESRLPRSDLVPARAGLVPGGQRQRGTGRAGPRACGVGPQESDPSRVPAIWSPRVRGWSRVPAHQDRRRVAGGGPRACGVGPRINSGDDVQKLWSPRVRGWSPEASWPGSDRAVVPARAGLVPRPWGTVRRLTGGPRACGVGPAKSSPAVLGVKWSPRVRGCSQPQIRHESSAPLVPARAGFSPSSAAPAKCRLLPAQPG